MKHLVISEYGSFLGVRKGLLLIRNSDKNEKLIPLNRLCSLSIAKRGVSISSDLIENLSVRGVKLFFLNFKGTTQATLIGNVHHGVVTARTYQYQYCSGNTVPLAKKVVEAKIKNQRAVLNYYAKYHKHEDLIVASGKLQTLIDSIGKVNHIDQLLGVEGASASLYFQVLNRTALLSSSFQHREGRGSVEINNSMLNFGYAILSSYILAAIENAGLEPYLGFIHSVRPGKMSLVLDIMEEYRAWVVDRAVIKLRWQSEKQTTMTAEIKKNLITEIQKTCSNKYSYRGKKVKLEHIIQRQIYRLSGQFCGNKKYRPYLFKW